MLLQAALKTISVSVVKYFKLACAGGFNIAFIENHVYF